MDWMDANQLGRRNLSSDAFKMSLGRLYNRTKKARGGDYASEKAIAQNEPKLNTAANLAAEHLVSENTVKRAGKFAEEVAKAAPSQPPAPATRSRRCKAPPRPCNSTQPQR